MNTNRSSNVDIVGESTTIQAIWEGTKKPLPDGNVTCDVLKIVLKDEPDHVTDNALALEQLKLDRANRKAKRERAMKNKKWMLNLKILKKTLTLSFRPLYFIILFLHSLTGLYRTISLRKKDDWFLDMNSIQVD